MDPSTTALVLVGFQRDYFTEDGGLHDVIADFLAAHQVLPNTLALVRELATTPVLMVSTPVVFTETYEELVDPVGVLALIEERRAFQRGQRGSEPIAELAAFHDSIVEVPGKRGFNAFANTELDEVLHRRGVTDVVLAGAITSLCIDSTARAAHERGYRVHVLSDCTASRSAFEHQFFCREIFPLYAESLDSATLLDRLQTPATRTA